MLSLLPPTARALLLAARQVTAWGQPVCSRQQDTITLAGASPGSAIVVCLGPPCAAWGAAVWGLAVATSMQNTLPLLHPK